ncbi:hypothetical protein DRP77_12175 [Candidatus Poribacteria bacterium]|nr:MAG: hypothetical protein DRP77_12175 [Candidatus Poribacteria bacterium]
MAALTVKVSQRGIITLPKKLRDAYRIRPGEMLTLIDLGGVFVLTPCRLQVDLLADKIVAQLQKRGESLESMLKALREERDRYEREEG